MAGTGSAAVFAYVGTYTRSLPHVQAKAEGVYVYGWTPRAATGSTSRPCPTCPTPPISLSTRSGRYLYAVNEVGELDGERGGARQRLLDRPVERQAHLPQPTVDARRGPLPL